MKLARFAFAFACAFPLLDGCAEKRSAPPAPASAAIAKEEADATAPVTTRCAAVSAAKVAAFEVDRTILDSPVPALVDPQGTLAPFYDRVAQLARGLGKSHVRIAMYGDSNLTADAMTGRMRRQLQARFGDAGHGFVALSQPWPWYSHNDVHHDGTWKGFRQIATSTNKVEDGHYGFANIASECGVPGCAAWVSTDPRPGAPIGWTASAFELYYLRRPNGGRFDLAVDGTVMRSVDTKSETFNPGFERIDLPDAHHEVKVVIRGGGPVRLYGFVVEREPPGIQVDSLGTGSLNLDQLGLPKPETRRPQLERRGYDLVIIQLGTNVFGGDKQNHENAKAFVAELRAAIPGVPVMFLSPPDVIEEGEKHSDPRIVSLQKAFAAIAKENGASFWDYRAAMGGEDSLQRFIDKGLTEHDHLHLKKQAHELMADRFLHALWDGLAARLESHPEAGCDATASGH